MRERVFPGDVASALTQHHGNFAFEVQSFGVGHGRTYHRLLVGNQARMNPEEQGRIVRLLVLAFRRMVSEIESDADNFRRTSQRRQQFEVGQGNGFFARIGPRVFHQVDAALKKRFQCFVTQDAHGLTFADTQHGFGISFKTDESHDCLQLSSGEPGRAAWN